MTRLMAFFDALMMLLFSFGNWDLAYGPIDCDCTYMRVFLPVVTFGAGRIIRLDTNVEQYEAVYQPLIERYPCPWRRPRTLNVGSLVGASRRMGRVL